MADVAKLESLSNKELHEKCLIFGLPNVPVTDSSRNVLIRKLRDAMTSQKKTNRRETIHQTTTPKPSASVPKESQHRRRTVNTVISKSFYDTTDNESGKPESSKKNVTIGGSQEFARRTLTTAPLSKSNVMSMSYDQEYNGPQFRTPKNMHKEDSDAESTQSNRSNVSLARSEIVTTSYRQEIEPSKRVIYEEEYDDDEEDYEPMDVDENDSVGNISGNSTKRTQHLSQLYSDSQLITNSFQNTHNSTPKHYINNYATSKYSSPSINQSNKPYTNESSRKPEMKHSTTDSNTQSWEFKKPLEINRNRYTTNNVYSPPYEVARESSLYSTNQQANRSNRNTLYPSLNEFYAPPPQTQKRTSTVTPLVPSNKGYGLHDDISETEDSESDLDAVLSNPKKMEKSTQEYSKLYKNEFDKPSKRRALHENSFRMKILGFLDSIDSKYHLKQIFAFIVLFVLSIFIYSIFFTN